MGKRLGFRRRNPRVSTLGRRDNMTGADVANVAGHMMRFAERVVWVAINVAGRMMGSAKKPKGSQNLRYIYHLLHGLHLV